MTPRRQQDSKRPAPRFVVVTNPIEAVDPAPDLAAVLGAADVAAVLLRLADADERSLINRSKSIAPVVQQAGAALLLYDRPDLVARAGADGAHLVGIEAFNAAADLLKPERIAGIGGLATRHDAMSAAERGADYVMFGEPDERGHRPNFDAIRERVDWWAEVFEVPCVAYAASLDEVGKLAAAGAEFIALGDWIWSDARGPAKTAADAAARLVAEPVA
jgi:thiamine-phosphate pyrophosphorylase